MMRKTVSLAYLLVEVNRRNKESTCPPEVRQGWNSLLESALHSAGVYQGFGYLRSPDIPAGQTPGVNNHAPVEDMSMEERFAGCDDTRRVYYVHDTLSRSYREQRAAYS